MMDVTETEVTPPNSASLGEAASGRGEPISNDGENDGGDDDDDDLYYIPERRPSLDLGPTPMDTSHWHNIDQALSPALSYSSMSSEQDTDKMEMDSLPTRVQFERSGSFSSCYTLDSDDCEIRIPKVKSEEEVVSEPSESPEVLEDISEFRHPSVTVAFTFKVICNTLKKLTEGDLNTFKTMLWKRYPQAFITSPQGMDMLDLVDRLLECYNLEMSLQITRNLLLEMGLKKMVDYMQISCFRNEVRHGLCEILKEKYSEVDEDFSAQGEKRPFDDVFTKPYITSTCNNGPNIDHEIMTIDKLSTNRDPGKEIPTKDILNPELMQKLNVRFMLIIGAPGSGKSMVVRKIILDWIEERAHKHVGFLFPLPFRELKQFEGLQVSLLDIIQKLYPPTIKLKEEDFRSEDCKIMFIFDGLDEYPEKIDMDNAELLSNPVHVSHLNVIVVNLLRGRLLYRGLFIVTTRSQVKRYVPWDTHCDEIELRGFHDPDKEDYFQRKFKDPDQAARVIEYINSSKTLRIMCHLPLFCSLVADECQAIFREKGTQAELPRSITYMYTKLLLLLIRQRRKFRVPDTSPENERDFLIKLGKLALSMLEQCNFKITKTDWKESGVSEEEAVLHSGLCIHYTTKPYVLYQEKVLSFIHPTMQEYLAALYAFLSFTNQTKNLFDQQRKINLKVMLGKGTDYMELYKSAVDKSLTFEDGRLDMFLRFLFGMAIKPNVELLQPFCTSPVKWPTFVEDAAALIKKKLRENLHPGRNDNLRHCLEELGLPSSQAASS
ncbi:NLR family CARD domain-containing protein 3-like [Betta splendens]|uniref:NLR family CARD domain-containing protein 3-like n=1 Tax=Betta splendens TaxID=158456 RepID=A0A6P7PEH7_BETSP|nr:NLR family CARD domain-containing protein 3-like [Betta splendens]XP_029028769.1 NLR family CARD domain-containing protein 3-like [Betta splendens]XP_055370491.1 NLR family CARD domain-containing protein 3-like [Betta splendens]